MAAWADPNTHGWAHHPSTDAEWKNLLGRYGAGADSSLAAVSEAGRANRCRTVVEENRYVDADFRSENAAFWAGRFEGRSAFTRRLHFFRKQIADADLHRLPRDPGYIGYSTRRPVPGRRVGRTMVTPPPRF